MTTRSALRIVVALAVAAAGISAARADDAAVSVSGTVHADKPGPEIRPEIYGQFAEDLGNGIYGGIWVGPDSPIPNTRGIRNDVVAALKEIQVPVLRWPGGCFADMYHWRDGVGPRDKRPKLVNTTWGGVTEDNSFGTDEFMDLCQQIGCQPYIALNMGSGTVKEMMDWIEYMTSNADTPMANLRRANGHDAPWKVKYVGIGNESWGCGGHMRPEYYADKFRQYDSFALNLSGNRLFRIACGPNGGDTTWTDKVMAAAAGQMNGISMHYYTLPTGNWEHKGSATDFDEFAWHATLKRALAMDSMIDDQLQVLDKHDPRHHVSLIVDEWGAWEDAEPGSHPGFLRQQNSLRDAMVAALTLQIFQRHADRVGMANIAQTVNVLQSMILTKDEKMVLTPTYYVFDMFKGNQGATEIPVDVKSPAYDLKGDKIPAVSVAASKSRDGETNVSLVNTDPNHPATVTLDLPGVSGSDVSGQVLTADKINAYNTFDNPDAVKPAVFNDAKLADGKLTANLPAKSIVMLQIK